MDCIYCGHKTTVLNSRPQKRLQQVWRRRHCDSCGAIFTTHEAVELAGSLVVRQTDSHDGHIKPFSRDKLFLSVYGALGHRKAPVADASALTATITAQLRKQLQGASITKPAIIEATATALGHFDEAAAVYYRAYHKS